MKQRINLHTIIKNIGLGSVIASALVFFLTLSATCLVGIQMYHYAKESLLLQGQVNAVRAAREYDNYLTVMEHGVSVAANVVSDMLAENKTSKEITEYLCEESDGASRIVKEEGYYGWIGGEYIDGERWVPDEDFVPTERPWYRETMADDSAVTFVSPYMDAQTQTIMTTMAVKLDDGVSVLAYDVKLAEIQAISERIASQTPGSYGIVLDKTGTVVAHSDHSELAKNYLEEKGTMGAELAAAVLHGNQQQFEFSYDNHIYAAYVENIKGEWKVISLLNTEVYYRPLMIILSLLIFFTILEALIFILVFINLSKKNLAISTQNLQIAAVADMYVSIFDIDILFDTIHRIRRGRNADKLRLAGENQRSAKKSLSEFFDKNVHESSKPLMEPFLDLETLSQRLENVETITEEFLNDSEHWCRGRFIVADRDKDGKVVRVLAMIESIDEEKKRRERLKRLSETDRMTGLYNRSAGEEKIVDLLQYGEGGMLLMIDVDKFKSINDVFGHDVGDQVIISIAESMAEAFRRSDIVMRLGGDEFIAYAPGVVTQEAAESIISRIFDNIAKVKIEELGDRKICVSMGIAFCRKGAIMTFAELYKQADNCVYESKKKEGNAVMFYQEQAPLSTAGQ